MPSLPTTLQIKTLHASYCMHSGLPLEFSMQKHYVWEVWMNHGWGEKELAMVIRLVKDKIRDKRKWSSALNFNRLIADMENFSIELAEAVAASRVRRVPVGLKQALRATGRKPEAKATPARSAEEIIRDGEAFKAFQRLKDQL